MGATTLVTGTCLDEIAGELAATRWAAQVFDAQWRLCWVSDELRALLGDPDDDALGIGRDIGESVNDSLWPRAITDDSQLRWLGEILPRALADCPAWVPSAREELGDEAVDWGLTETERARKDIWASHIDFLRGELPPMRVNYVANRVRNPDGSLAGYVYVYGTALPASLLPLLTQGDEGMFHRMARLVEPGRRSAAILFADLRASGALSRRLASATYFKAVRDATTAIDEVVVSRRGIVGKHAGDGVTAFFVCDDFESESATARAALDAALAIPPAAAEAAGRTLDLADLRAHPISVGVHWGGALYMGQVVTGGRLEVTALGDEVNECARIQQVAAGRSLASKGIVERLDIADAIALDIDPDRLVYKTLAEVGGASEKALRDAATVPVTAIGTIPL